MIIESLKKNWLLIVVGVVVIVFLLIFNDSGNKADSGLAPVLPTLETEELDKQQKVTTVIVDVKGEVNNPGVYEIDSNSRINDVIKLAGGFSEDADEIPVNLAQKVQDEMTIIVPKVGEVAVSTGGGIGSGKIRINYATQEEIETLSGIGPSKAQAIIQYRDEHGFFKVVEDLLEVSGIGQKTLENIRDELQIP